MTQLPCWSVSLAGANVNGRLGLGDNVDKPQFTRVSHFSTIPITGVSCGAYNTLFVSAENELFLCGATKCRDGSSLFMGATPAPPVTQAQVQPNASPSLTASSTPPQTTPPQTPSHRRHHHHHKTVATPTSSPTPASPDLTPSTPSPTQTPSSTVTATPAQPRTFEVLPVPLPFKLPQGKVRQVALGTYHAMLLTDEGRVHSWGSSSFGQLGLGATSSVLTPQLIPGLAGVIQIAAGTSHSAAVTELGELYTWGKNTTYQLGHGDPFPRKNPFNVKISSSSDTGIKVREFIKQVACGDSHTVCLTDSRKVFLWGQCNNSGAVTPTPEEFKLDSFLVSPVIITQIACGQWHTVLVTNTGTVIYWKLGEQPQLICGELSGKCVVQVACGSFHTMCVTDEGVVYSFGEKNSSCQLGRTTPTALGDTSPGVVEGLPPNQAFYVSSGEYHTAVITVTHSKYLVSQKLLRCCRRFFLDLIIVIKGFMNPIRDAIVALDRKPKPISLTMKRGSLPELSSSFCRTDMPALMPNPPVSPLPTTRFHTVRGDRKKLLQEDPLISEEDFNLIFSNFEPMLKTASALLQSVDDYLAHSTQKTLGDAILENALFSITLLDYIDVYNDIQHGLFNAKKRSDLLTTLLREIEESIPNKFNNIVHRDLKSLLFTPVQFIPRIFVFVQEIFNSVNENDPDYVPLNSALRKIGFLLARTNENFQFVNPLDILNCTSDESGQLQIMGATLEGLVDKLTHHNITDPNFRQVFLLTFRTFTSPVVLLKMLIEKAKSLGSNWTAKQRIYHVLDSWVVNHFYDFKQEEEVLAMLVEFLDDPDTGEDEKNFKQHLHELLKQLNNESPSPDILVTETETTAFDFSSVSPYQIACGLALISHNLFSRIGIQEFFGKAWEKADAAQRCPNLLAFTSRFNMMSSWSSTEISNRTNKNLQIAELCHMLDIAAASEGLNDYYSLTAIIYGLLSISDKYRKQISKEHLALLERLEELVSPLRNYKNMRQKVQSTKPPCVPFLALTIKDLTFIEDGNQDYIRDDIKVINFFKRRKVAEVLLPIKQYQQIKYSTTETPDAPLLAYLQTLNSRAKKP